jgi:tetratricopeptide (TPR) repeat protein
MTKFKLFSLLAALVLLPATLLGQTPTASLHGHVNNAAGLTIPEAQVKLTTDKAAAFKDQKFKYTFDIDGNGDYKGTGIAPGDYLAIVVAKNTSVDFFEVSLKAGDDKVLNFDMTRKEYIDKMSPEDKAALEEYKKRAGAAMNANKVVANLNATLKTVRADLTEAAKTKGDVSKDVTDMKAAVDAKPDEGILWLTYADTLQAQGDFLAKQAKSAGKPVLSDPDVQKQYSDAVDADKKAIDLNVASKKPDPLVQATAYNQIGNAQAKAGKVTEASTAFEAAAKLQPANAGMYYGNEAAVLFNAANSGANSIDAAGAAADKAIAADPNRADAYYIKGQALITKATVDKAGKVVAPPGCAEAYQKFLELAPDSPRAEEVRQLLTSMGQTINTKYRAPGKK